MYKNILLPTDGSPASRKTIQAGVRLARSVGAKVTGFFAAPPATPMVYKNFLPVGYMDPEQHAAMIRNTAEKYLGVVKEEAAKAGVPCKLVHVTNDFPAEAIIAAAQKEKCDLIFMASHGRRGIKGLLLGSETQKVLTHGKVAVLVSR